MTVRGFIPEGEEPTPAEQAVIEKAIPRDLNRVEANFIPDPSAPIKEDISREEKSRLAYEAALRRQERADADEYKAAELKLGKLSARDAVEFVSDLSPRLKSVYARAELDGQARATVLKALSAFAPKE